MSDTNRRLNPAAKVRGDDFNRLRAEVLASRLTGASGLRLGAFGSGMTAAGIPMPPVIRRTPATPFRIQPVDGAAAVTIFPGDVENIIPTIGGTSIAAATPPQLAVSTGSVYLECTMDAAGTLTAAEIKNTASLPANTSTLRYRQLGAVSVSGTVVTVTAQTVNTSVSHKLCGGLSTWGQA